MSFALPVLHNLSATETGPDTLLGMPEPAAPRGELHWFEDGPGSEEVSRLLTAVHRALASYREDAPSVLFSLTGISPAGRKLLGDTLSDGEVVATVTGARRWELKETALVGLWHIASHDAKGALEGEWLEVAGVPSAILAADAQGTVDKVSIGHPPEGAMNSLPVLAELQHRVATYHPDAPNHVVSFTLLPMNPVDMGYLQTQLGHGPVRAESRGYGACRVELTNTRHLWSVQYLNSTGKVILDTLELGQVPNALRASNEDFEDSAVRLRELLQERV